MLAVNCPCNELTTCSNCSVSSATTSIEYGPKTSSLNFSSAKNAVAVISVTTATPWFVLLVSSLSDFAITVTASSASMLLDSLLKFAQMPGVSMVAELTSAIAVFNAALNLSSPSDLIAISNPG